MDEPVQDAGRATSGQRPDPVGHRTPPGHPAGRTRRGARRALLGLAVVAVLASLAAVLTLRDDRAAPTETAAVGAAATSTTRRGEASQTRWRPTTSTTVEPTTTSEATPDTTEPPLPPPPPPSTAAPAPPTTAARAPSPEAQPAPVPAPVAAPVPAFPAGGIGPFQGLGVWIDVLDWSPSYTGGSTSVRPAAVDRMADLGVQTIYIQSSRYNRPEDVIDPGILGQFIDRAHARGLRIVAWYMPTHEDHEEDVRRLVAAAGLPVDGVVANIESTNQPDIGLRNARLLDLSVRLRQATAKPLGIVVIPPVVTEVLNRNYWPQFPWRQLSGTYDAWMPMAYWSNRTPESGWRDGYRYIAENTTMVRSLTGRGDLPVHPVGGIGNEITVDEVNGMALALHDTGAIGGSIYDYATTGDHLWPSLHNFRR